MHFLGVDIGTQSAKAVVVTDELRVVADASAAYTVEHPRPGRAEQDPRQWELALERIVPQVVSESGLGPDDIAAVGISGQLDGCVSVDAGGKAVSPCLIWMDRRAEKFLPPMPEQQFRQRTGQIADAGHMAAKISWLRANGDKGARYHQPVSYMVEQMTGESVMDPCLASTTMLCSLETGGWDEELLSSFEISSDWLPRLAPANSLAGTCTQTAAQRFGLREGTPVVVGTGDDFATPLGAGVVAPGPAVCVLGTAEVIAAVSAEKRLDDRGLLETHCWLTDGYFLENPGWPCDGRAGCLDFLTTAHLMQRRRGRELVRRGRCSCRHCRVPWHPSGTLGPEGVFTG